MPKCRMCNTNVLFSDDICHLCGTSDPSRKSSIFIDLDFDDEDDNVNDPPLAVATNVDKIDSAVENRGSGESVRKKNVTKKPRVSNRVSGGPKQSLDYSIDDFPSQPDSYQPSSLDQPRVQSSVSNSNMDLLISDVQERTSISKSGKTQKKKTSTDKSAAKMEREVKREKKRKGMVNSLEVQRLKGSFGSQEVGICLPSHPFLATISETLRSAVDDERVYLLPDMISPVSSLEDPISHAACVTFFRGTVHHQSSSDANKIISNYRCRLAGSNRGNAVCEANCTCNPLQFIDSNVRDALFDFSEEFRILEPLMVQYFTGAAFVELLSCRGSEGLKADFERSELRWRQLYEEQFVGRVSSVENGDNPFDHIKEYFSSHPPRLIVLLSGLREAVGEYLFRNQTQRSSRAPLSLSSQLNSHFLSTDTGNTAVGDNDVTLESIEDLSNALFMRSNVELISFETEKECAEWIRRTRRSLGEAPYKQRPSALACIARPKPGTSSILQGVDKTSTRYTTWAMFQVIGGLSAPKADSLLSSPMDSIPAIMNAFLDSHGRPNPAKSNMLEDLMGANNKQTKLSRDLFDLLTNEDPNFVVGS